MLITLRGGPSRSNEHELATPRCRWPASESVLRFHRPPFEFSWIRNPSRLSRVSLKRWNVYIATWIVYILSLCLSFSLCSPFSLVFQASFLFFSFLFLPFYRAYRRRSLSKLRVVVRRKTKRTLGWIRTSYYSSKDTAIIRERGFLSTCPSESS